MITNIFYFSGTGNSLHVARKLHQKIIDSKLIPIARILEENKSKKTIKLTANSIGFVFPCHGLTIPIPIKYFLKKVDLSSSKYIFAIVTRGGTVFRGFSLINKILRKQDKQLNSTFIIDMALNDPKLKYFRVPAKDELRIMENNVQNKLELIYDVISDQVTFSDEDNGANFSRFRLLNFILERLVPFTVHNVASKVKKYFYADINCNGCGICEKICPSQKIVIENDKPVWQKDKICYICYGCLNFCPNQAIQIYSKIYMKSYTEEKGRYPHPYANVIDMINQKKISKVMPNIPTIQKRT